MKIAIIGAGEIGSALNHILPKEGNAIFLYDKQPGKIKDQKPLPETLAGAEVVFLGVPSWVIRSAALDIKSYLPASAILAYLSKGLESGTGKTVYQMLEEELPGISLALISGPMLGEELMAGQGGAAVIATEREDALQILQPLLSQSGLVTSASDDIKGVSLSGVLKNVYSIGLGMAHALRWDQSMTGWLFDRSFEEMKRIVGKLGGKSVTADSPAGLGDLIATGSSDYSNNRQYGIELVGHGSSLIKCEGGVSIAPLKTLLGGDLSEYPVLACIHAIVEGRASASEEFAKLKQ